MAGQRQTTASFACGEINRWECGGKSQWLCFSTPVAPLGPHHESLSLPEHAYGEAVHWGLWSLSSLREAVQTKSYKDPTIHPTNTGRSATHFCLDTLEQWRRHVLLQECHLRLRDRRLITMSMAMASRLMVMERELHLVKDPSESVVLQVASLTGNDQYCPLRKTAMLMSSLAIG